MKKNPVYLCILVVCLGLTSCATLIKGVTGGLASGVYQQNDMELLEDGGPSFLLIVESMIYNNPENRDYLMSGIQLFSSYSGAFVKDPVRQKLFNDKVAGWGNALLNTYPLYKKYSQIPGTEKEAKEAAYKNFVAGIKKKDVPYVFWGIYTVAMKALTQTDSPEGLLYLPKVLAVAEKIYQLDDTFFDGMPHLFFGIYYGAYPESFGGSPVKSKAEFEKAIEISGGTSLLYKVMFAEFYYKGQYDKDNYEKLLNEVVGFDVNTCPAKRLMNLMAQEQAAKLLADIDTIFF